MSSAAGTMTPELEFFCVGLNHETSPLEIRDALVLSDEEVGRAIRALRERAGASEALVISTCNRTEVYARGAELPNPPAFVAALLQEIKGLDLVGSRPHLDIHVLPGHGRHRHAGKAKADKGADAIEFFASVPAHGRLPVRAGPGAGVVARAAPGSRGPRTP